MKIKAYQLRKIVMETLSAYEDAAGDIAGKADQITNEIVKRASKVNHKVPGFSALDLESKAPSDWDDASQPLNRVEPEHEQDNETWPEIPCPFEKQGL